MCFHRGPDKGPDQDTALVLDRQHSPDSPLDAVEFLDSTLTPGMPPSKSTSGVPSSDKLRGVPMAAAGLPAVPAPGSCTRLTSASTSAASCPSNFLGKPLRTPLPHEANGSCEWTLFYAANKRRITQHIFPFRSFCIIAFGTLFTLQCFVSHCMDQPRRRLAFV